jgi:hypothetical protein
MIMVKTNHTYLRVGRHIACRKHTSGVRGLACNAYVLCVSGFPCRVYIDLNRRDSQI